MNKMDQWKNYECHEGSEQEDYAAYLYRDVKIGVCLVQQNTEFWHLGRTEVDFPVLPSGPRNWKREAWPTARKVLLRVAESLAGAKLRQQRSRLPQQPSATDIQATLSLGCTALIGGAAPMEQCSFHSRVAHGTSDSVELTFSLGGEWTGHLSLREMRQSASREA